LEENAVGVRAAPGGIDMASVFIDAFIRPAHSLVALKSTRAVQVLVFSALCSLLSVAQAGAAVLGVDVSGYDGTVDWNQVRNVGGKAFAFIHSTSGVNTTDKNFAVNAAAARDAGLLVGAYHFAYPQYFTAHQEAQKFLSVAGAYIGAGYLPPVLDVEDSKSDNSYPYLMGAAALSQWIRDWCSEVEQATGVPGRRVILYTIRWYPRNNYFQSDLNQHPFWVATYPTDPTTDPGNIAPWTTWTFQQYRARA
jgi:GH25 family lysozyme M1 (1,4-beta-N-acetylmuramidase)